MASGDKLDGAQLIDFYRRMLLIRVFEERSAEQYMLGRIRGFLHLYNGEEAIAISSLQPDDYVVTHYRDHGHALAKGMDPNAAMAELFGKATGCSKGKGGSMHLFDLEKRFMGGHAIVGGQLPLSTGFALASKLRGDGDIALCFLGDGAINEGEFHESLNLASLWKLPVLFFVENNLYGMGATVEQMLAFHDEIYKFANGYKIPVCSHRRHGRAEGAGGHAGGDGPRARRQRPLLHRGDGLPLPRPLDGGPCRVPGQVRGGALADARPHHHLRHARSWTDGTATQEELDEIRSEVEEIIDAAVQFAEESPFPEPGRALRRRVRRHVSMAVITYREAVGRALREALQDERVFMMGEDIGRYGGAYAVTRGLLDEFGPERIRETPIAESGFTGAGAGAAMAGMRPIVELMTINFSLLAMDQIINHAAKVRYMSGGQLSCPAHRAHCHRRRRFRGSNALAEPGGLVRGRARAYAWPYRPLRTTCWAYSVRRCCRRTP